MKSLDIREKFLRFFAEKEHTRIDSSPLVPANDPTLLFTNSGMVQFKDVFLGFDKPHHHTATTAQRCLRAGGKHNDLENVGYTARHHTFFEMLGNFSFGAYFKEKAIPYAWEFLTSPQWLGLKKEHLWVTVFGGGHLFGDDSPPVPADDDAYALWLKTLVAAGFNEAEAAQRITRIPTTDNFWMMGETGPCGPCSEIFYDRDKNSEYFRGTDESHADDCVEVWNLVFMEFNRDDTGLLNKLPKPCVDTGMGLERISAVMQKVHSNYEIDLFADLLKKVNDKVTTAGGKDSGNDYTPSHKVIADHIRAAAFLIADGVMPTNEGRGYVLRRIIRRALRHGHKLGAQQAFFYQLIRYLPALMGGAHPILQTRLSLIEKILQTEEENFSTLLRHGMTMLRRELGTLGTQRKLTGDTVFKLYDTYGFPADMTADVAREEGIAVDMAGFEAHMSTQRKRSRAAMTFNIGQKTIAYDGVATEFVGYDDTETEVEVLALFVNGEAVKEARAGQEALVVLNRTPFYAQSGGQVGDIGLMCSKETKIRVTDTHKIRTDVWGHMATIDAGAVHTGMIVRGEVDATRRDAIRCNHSATHLMHAALRQVLGQHVEQKGSLVSPDYLRFDFSHHTAVSNDELRAVETIVNEQIRHNHSVETQSLPYDDALNLGAMALFGEKYGDIVRTVIIDRDFSVELCGGSHVTRTGNIGFFQFRSEGAIAAGVRRVEAVTARSAVAHAQHLHTRLQHISNLMKSSTDKVEEKIIQLRESLKETNKRLEALQAAQADQLAIQLAQLAVAHNGAQILVATDADTDIKALRELAVQLRERLSPAAVLLAGSNGDTAAFVAATDKSLNISAREWIDVVATVANAKGGGKIDFAQAGGGDCTQIDAALTAARAFVGIK